MTQICYTKNCTEKTAKHFYMVMHPNEQVMGQCLNHAKYVPVKFWQEVELKEMNVVNWLERSAK